MDDRVYHKVELEDDCLISDLIDHFIDSFKIAKFFICKDEKGALVFDDNKTLNGCNLKYGDTLYCYKEPVFIFNYQIYTIIEGLVKYSISR